MTCKIVALSGTHGSGKSTLLQELTRRGYSVDTFKVSRAVQAQLGWESLDVVMRDPFIMMEFQEKIFQQKLNRERELLTLDAPIVLTERSFADIYAYSVLWMTKFLKKRVIHEVTAADWLSDFCERCLKAQKNSYSAVLVLPLMEHIQFETEANRAKEEDADSFNQIFNGFLTTQAEFNIPVFNITAPSIESRADQVQSFLTKLCQAS